MNNLKDQKGTTLLEISVAMLMVTFIMMATVYFSSSLTRMIHHSDTVSERKIIMSAIEKVITDKLIDANTVEEPWESGVPTNRIIIRTEDLYGTKMKTVMTVPTDGPFKGRLILKESEYNPDDGSTADDVYLIDTTGNIFGDGFYDRYHIMLEAVFGRAVDGAATVIYTLTMYDGDAAVYNYNRTVKILNSLIPTEPPH